MLRALARDDAHRLWRRSIEHIRSGTLLHWVAMPGPWIPHGSHSWSPKMRLHARWRARLLRPTPRRLLRLRPRPHGQSRNASLRTGGEGLDCTLTFSGERIVMTTSCHSLLPSTVTKLVGRLEGINYLQVQPFKKRWQPTADLFSQCPTKVASPLIQV